MGTNSDKVVSQVYKDHLSYFPDSVDANRQNTVTGVPYHNVVKMFLTGLINGLVNAGQLLYLQDESISGTDDVPGNCASALTLNMKTGGADSAVSLFLKESGWSGRDSKRVAEIFIGQTLTYFTQYIKVEMQSHNTMGTGTSALDFRNIPNLTPAVIKNALLLGLQQTNCFNEGDIPGNPINKVLAETLDYYAIAFCEGFKNMYVANIQYTGTTLSSGPVTSAKNLGTFKV